MKGIRGGWLTVWEMLARRTDCARLCGALRHNLLLTLILPSSLTSWLGSSDDEREHASRIRLTNVIFLIYDVGSPGMYSTPLLLALYIVYRSGYSVHSSDNSLMKCVVSSKSFVRRRQRRGMQRTETGMKYNKMDPWS